AVVERDGDTDAIALGVLERFADEEGVIQDIVMGEGRTLWPAGRTRRVLNVDWVVELQARFALGQQVVCDLTAGIKESVPFLVEDDGASQTGTVRPCFGEHRPIFGLPESASKKQYRDAGLLQRIFE